MASKGAHDEDNLSLSLRIENAWADTYQFYLFENFWCPSIHFQAVNSFKKEFQAKDSDIVVASFPKSGTIWLKALTFAIVNRQRFSSLEDHPLLSSNPHELVPFFEFIFGADDIHGQILHLSNMAEPRIFGTHTPFPSLPESIKESNCKIVYICRNPFDNFVSAWNYFNKIKPTIVSELTLEEAFELYCNGVMEYGPWWSHMLGYWEESIAKPDKVLFLKYDDLKEDINFHVKSVAKFLGCPFTEEEENNGVVESIIKLCSFEKMKDLAVNKSGMYGRGGIEKKNFFRKGENGDWVNYFSPSMTEKLSKIVEEKLSGSGLSFKMCS
ncbi:desulfoglucosinolate sulfotransferase A/B/C [Vigna unguiculata]|uniref:Sulfotransferase n=1 Tax=Vigna unguiculata TaxID=3917 RepID=A0A4D6LB71_VIGUN|nr:desulfoglucosinolate sulfotransferase A/B/C [Vigna unguiculata]